MSCETWLQRSWYDIFEMGLAVKMVSLADIGCGRRWKIVQMEQNRYAVKEIKKFKKSTCQTNRTVVY